MTISSRPAFGERSVGACVQVSSSQDARVASALAHRRATAGAWEGQLRRSRWGRRRGAGIALRLGRSAGAVRVAACRQRVRGESAGVRDDVSGRTGPAARRHHPGAQRPARPSRSNHARCPGVGAALRPRRRSPTGARYLADRRAAVRPPAAVAVADAPRRWSSPNGCPPSGQFPSAASSVCGVVTCWLTTHRSESARRFGILADRLPLFVEAVG